MATAKPKKFKFTVSRVYKVRKMKDVMAENVQDAASQLQSMLFSDFDSEDQEDTVPGGDSIWDHA